MVANDKLFAAEAEDFPYGYPVGDVKKSLNAAQSAQDDNEPFFEYACVECDQKK